jgi:chromosomal replication initiator protein
MNRARREGKSLRWRYVTAEGFTNEFIGALRQKKLEEFRARYRQLDLLAIDDVHFLAAKRATQDEFLHTFNAIANQGNQIILASDTHPRLVADLNEQLVSRFLAGMVVKIDTPDAALRLKILQRLVDRLGMNVSPEVLEYISSHVHGSVRELEGTLVKLGALAALESGLVTLDLARETLADHLVRTESAISLGDIEAVVSSFFGVSPADIHSSRRTRTVSAARAVTMLLARRHTQMSFPEIGRAIGKNHSSVVLGVQRMEKLLEEDGLLEWLTPEGKRRMPIRQVLEGVGKQIF